MGCLVAGIREEEMNQLTLALRLWMDDRPIPVPATPTTLPVPFHLCPVRNGNTVKCYCVVCVCVCVCEGVVMGGGVRSDAGEDVKVDLGKEEEAERERQLEDEHLVRATNDEPL